jgi:hypothetical protein
MRFQVKPVLARSTEEFKLLRSFEDADLQKNPVRCSAGTLALSALG